MRSLLIFLLGALAGAAATWFLLPRELPVTPPSVVQEIHPEAAPTAPPKNEERQLAERVGIQLSPAESSMEKNLQDEPQRKVVPPLPPPPEAPADALMIPVVGVRRDELRSMFHERRGGGREHRAIDIAAPRGTAVIAAIDGTVGKLFLSKPGGITLYQYDPTKSWIYYYAHLDAYAPGIVEGAALHRGDVIGYVGTSGNAPPNAPHLHFAIEKLTEPGRWWKSEPIDPYPLLMSRGVTVGSH